MLGNFKNFTVLFKDLVLSDRIEENFKWKLTYFLFLSIFSKFSILPRSTKYRIAITNKNVPAMIGQIATSLGELGLNIADMTNVSRGDVAYNLIDIENEVKEEALTKLSLIENVINVRLII